MALRAIREKDDDILYKKCKVVKKFDEKLSVLLDDMYETMTTKEGVGLAAPQVGILKRAVVIDIGEDESGRVELINPEIIETRGEKIDNEGCLSVPGVFGKVKRPTYVKVKAQDRYGKWFTLQGEDLLARAICHEVEHLEGKLFLDKVIEFVE